MRSKNAMCVQKALINKLTKRPNVHVWDKQQDSNH